MLIRWNSLTVYKGNLLRDTKRSVVAVLQKYELYPKIFVRHSHYAENYPLIIIREIELDQIQKIVT